jgi:hypothetical protein
MAPTSRLWARQPNWTGQKMDAPLSRPGGGTRDRVPPASGAISFARGIVTGRPRHASRLRDLRGSGSKASRARPEGRANATEQACHPRHTK